MSPRPLDRDAVELFRADIEHVLGEEETAVLHGWAKARGIPADRWLTQPDLARVGTTQAALRIFEEARDSGRTVEAATISAAIRVGIEPSTFTKRRRRFGPRAHRSPAKKRDKSSSIPSRPGRHRKAAPTTDEAA